VALGGEMMDRGSLLAVAQNRQWVQVVVAALQ
jgi:hypothetical protein